MPPAEIVNAALRGTPQPETAPDPRHTQLADALAASGWHTSLQPDELLTLGASHELMEFDSGGNIANAGDVIDQLQERHTALFRGADGAVAGAELGDPLRTHASLNDAFRALGRTLP